MFPILIPVFAAGGIFLYRKLKAIKGKRLLIFGPIASGKTTLYCRLRGVQYNGYESTGENEYDGFQYTKTDGSVINIASGIDFGGDKDYNHLIRQRFSVCDCAIMLFDLRKYVESEAYMKDVKSRLDLCYSHISSKKTSVSVLMTHADEFGSSSNELKNAIKKFKTDIAGKSYEQMIVKDNLIPVNLNDVESMKKIIDKLL